MSIFETPWFRVLSKSAIVIAVAGCASTQSPDQAAVEVKGSDPISAAPANGALASTAPVTNGVVKPDASGIVAYDGYEAAVASSGDTVATVAERIGLSASELGAYNGLSPTHPLQAGDELVLPPRPGGYATASAPAPSPSTPTDSTTTPIVAAPLQSGTANSVESSQPAASESATWSPDIAAAAIDRADGFDEQGNLAAPPSAEEPLPPSPQEPSNLDSPDLRQYQSPTKESATTESAAVPVVESTPAPATEPDIPTPTPAPARSDETVASVEPQVVDNAEPSEAPKPATEVAVAATEPTEPPKTNSAQSSELSLIRPVSGPVIIGFLQGAGQTRNEGIDFASPSGSPVVAATSGEVALVSQSLGGLGTIVLVRHLGGEYLTVYGRIEKVTVKKGDIVEEGQQIGVVSPSTQPRMHFQVRRGAESLDPEQFFR